MNRRRHTASRLATSRAVGTNVGGYRFARRAFLGTAAAGGLFLPLLRRIEARAELGAPPPPRFLVIHRAVGTVFDADPEFGGTATHWRPLGEPSQTATGTLALNTGLGTEPAAQVSGVSAGLEPLRDKTTVIDGLDIVTAGPPLAGGGASNNGGFRTHEGGVVAIMTGAPSVRRVGQQDHKAGGASIDQIFLANSPLLGGTPFGSLYLGTDARSDRNEVSPRVLSYLPPPAGAQPTLNDPATMTEVLGPDAVPLFPELNPLVVYQRLFGSLMPGGVEANAETLAQLRLERGTLLDYLERDLQRLERLVPATERALIDAHVSAIQSLEVSFNATLNALEGGGSCALLTGPGAVFAGWDPNVPGNQAGSNPFHEQIGLLQLAIIRTAFACDFARTATFMWSPGTNQVVFGALYAGMREEQHHATSHADTQIKDHDLVAIERWYVDRTVEALLEFDAIQEADGSTLLDNTVVPFISEVARGFNHNNINTPWAIIGGSKFGIPGNRFYRADGANRPTNDLWLALAPAFQVDLPTLGTPDMYSGPLPDFVV